MPKLHQAYTPVNYLLLSLKEHKIFILWRNWPREALDSEKADSAEVRSKYKN